MWGAIKSNMGLLPGKLVWLFIPYYILMYVGRAFCMLPNQQLDISELA